MIMEHEEPKNLVKRCQDFKETKRGRNQKTIDNENEEVRVKSYLKRKSNKKQNTP